ncbi:MAG: hypothetical protein JO246_01290 [Frankiaceae bacterium]|nr:hypothetical protein [Frankiaceae bacterium]MBV9869309.1 hypothetical protein [Frankiaceae bacterium]
MLIVAALLILGPFHPSGIHPSSWLTNPFPDVLPGIVPWAGALGGVCISLVGVAGHARASDWRPEAYGYWHLTRSVLGAFFGSVSVLIVSLLLQNVKQIDTTGDHFTDSGKAVLAVIAFVVGFREETFRSLIVRVVDVILGPNSPDAEARYNLVPRAVSFEDAKVGRPSKHVIHLVNGGKKSVTLHRSAVTTHGKGLDASLAGDSVTLADGETAPIVLTWKPTEVGHLTGSVSVRVAGTVITAAVNGDAT